MLDIWWESQYCGILKVLIRTTTGMHFYSFSSYFFCILKCFNFSMLSFLFSNLVKQIALVSAEDMARVAPKYVPSLFKSDNSRVTIVVHTSKAAEVAAGFKE